MRTGVSVYSIIDEFTTWYAPVNLPHGAVITGINASVRDYDPSWDVDFLMYRVRAPYLMADWMVSLETSGSSPGWQCLETTDIRYPTIDNQHYTYYFVASLWEQREHELGSIFINYTVNELP